MNIHEVTPKILTEFNAADLEFSGEAPLPMFVNISFVVFTYWALTNRHSA